MTASADAKFNVRMIAASFGLGVSLMVLAGFVAPTIIRGGLSMATANASTIEAQAPLIQPLDVAAIEAQLAEANRSMETARATTDAAMDRLDALQAR